MSKDSQLRDLIPVPVLEFMSGNQLPVDVYIRLGQDKFVLAAKKDDPSNLKELSAFKGRSVDYVYVHRDEFSKYVAVTLTIADIAIKRPGIPDSARAHFLSHAAHQVMEEFGRFQITEEIFSHAQTVADCTITLVEHQSDLNGLLKSLADLGNHEIRHAMATSALSVMIGKALGWNARNTLEKLALGGLIHDIGKRALPPELIQKSVSQMAPDEILQYETHPHRGVEMLKNVRSVPDDVIACILEHHENAIGQGFPRRLRDLRLNPLGRVVALADCFNELTLSGPERVHPMSSDKALNYIANTLGQPYNKLVYQALCSLIPSRNNKAA